MVDGERRAVVGRGLSVRYCSNIVRIVPRLYSRVQLIALEVGRKGGNRRSAEGGGGELTLMCDVVTASRTKTKAKTMGQMSVGVGSSTDFSLVAPLGRKLAALQALRR